MAKTDLTAASAEAHQFESEVHHDTCVVVAVAVVVPDPLPDCSVVEEDAEGCSLLKFGIVPAADYEGLTAELPAAASAAMGFGCQIAEDIERAAATA